MRNVCMFVSNSELKVKDVNVKCKFNLLIMLFTFLNLGNLPYGSPTFPYG